MNAPPSQNGSDLVPPAGAAAPRAASPLVCFSHLRWNFVWQRPQHLMVRLARTRNVFFVEEPIRADDGIAGLRTRRTPEGITVVVPALPEGLDAQASEAAQTRLLAGLLRERDIAAPVLWYYTPMALAWSAGVRASATVYDCMDELSAFKDAPPALRQRERELFRRADLVFTGGQSLYEAKRLQHHAVHAFPSSVDTAHFAAARAPMADPADQARIPHPRLGFYGVIDERLDLDLLAAVADARPDWQLVMVGPVVKIDPAILPQRPNIHWLGPKTYAELPAYLSGWDAAMMPFALNESTRFISPTKTPEYLAAGRPVVSTPITDVVRTYGHLDGVRIASSPAEFVDAAAGCLALGPSAWRKDADALLADMS